jgi:hypothetical protein
MAAASLSTVEPGARRPRRSLPTPPSTLLLLYAQPLVRIAALKTTAIVLTPQKLRISLGAEPIPAPEPFAGMLRFHLHNRPNLRITGDTAVTAAALRVVSISVVGGCVISGSVGVTCGSGDMG